MKYFFDTEFKEEPNTIQLISIGIKAEDGREYYAVSKDFDIDYIWEDKWLKDNVLPSILNDLGGTELTIDNLKSLIDKNGKSNDQIASDIKEFCDDAPEFYAYYADYDWVVFCWLFGRMIDLPEGFPMFCIDLKQEMDSMGLDDNWKNKNCPSPDGEHNALVDARWNMELFNNINIEKFSQNILKN